VGGVAGIARVTERLLERVDVLVRTGPEVVGDPQQLIRAGEARLVSGVLENRDRSLGGRPYLLRGHRWIRAAEGPDRLQPASALEPRVASLAAQRDQLLRRLAHAAELAGMVGSVAERNQDLAALRVVCGKKLDSPRK
jgi:hypothetical protein